MCTAMDIDELLSGQPALRARPSQENTREVLDLVRSQERETIKTNLINEANILRKAVRHVYPLPSIGGETSTQRTRRHSERFDSMPTRSPNGYRWRSQSDALLLTPNITVGKYSEPNHLASSEVERSFALPDRPECPTPSQDAPVGEGNPEFLEEPKNKTDALWQGRPINQALAGWVITPISPSSN